MSNSIYPTLEGGLMREVERTPVHDTIYQRESSGRELRVARGSSVLYRYRIEYDFLRQDAGDDEFSTLMDFFEAHQGGASSFLFTDPYSPTAAAMGFGIGTGGATSFQLQYAMPAKWSDALGRWDRYTTPRTNWLTQSTTFSTWTLGSGVTLTQAAGIAPDGTATAVRINLASSGGGVFIHSPNFTGDASVWTGSVYLRADVGSSADLGFYNGTTFATVTACAVQSGPGAASISGGMGRVTGLSATAWTRVTFTSTLTTASTWRSTVYPGAFGAATAGQHIMAWQAQASVQGGTRPIATTTSAVTVSPAYWPATGEGFEPVRYPVWTTVSIWVGSTLLVPGTDWTPGANGTITTSGAPGLNTSLTWTGSYYRRVRFDGDTLQVQRRDTRIWKASVDLVSVIE